LRLMLRINFFAFKGVAPPTHSRSARCRSFGGVISKACFFCRLLLKKEHVREIVHMPGRHTIAGSRAVLEKTGGR